MQGLFLLFFIAECQKMQARYIENTDSVLMIMPIKIKIIYRKKELMCMRVSAFILKYTTQYDYIVVNHHAA